MSIADPPDTPVAPAGGPGGDHRHTWATVLIVLLVLGGVLTMLLTGHPVGEALMLGAGVTLLGGAVARRILTGAGPMPTVVVAAAVTVFAVVLLVRGYPISDAAMICGLVGLVAGEVAARHLDGSRK
ncbi:hypothetical protein [Actinoplanes teichomyceticus]|uniref:Uncharacterized protein n=1 Tax=Actinoplanes teichomyceticus TaxID=1867 RepID=A0A561WAL0_ACTTI|nr:hypothetical protein [Actinoplanes teichomyceticus]TWG20893.1 hypothetical protein FHX34_103422 [Actinoplanes teichomyceticus]GIF16480.1 hypothetical protein Ate01nite_65120 [Actinoplanes teichomyceticus]